MTTDPVSRASRLAVGVGLAAAWTFVWVQQSRAWQSDPEYAYGWAVPLLALFLAGERWISRPVPGAGHSAWLIALVLVGPVALVSRMALEPFASWPAMLWTYSLTAVILTLAVAGHVGGWAWARHAAFPVLFTLTALPWPGVLQRPIVQALRSFVASAAAMLVDLIGYPARASGSVIEIASGWLGVDEACSGLRSLQATMMAALFLGEYVGTTVRRRALLVGAGLVTAIATNVLRTTVLTWYAARTGAPIASVHDLAGYAVLALNVGILGGVAWRWWRRDHPAATEATANRSSTPAAIAPPGHGGPASRREVTAAPILAVLLLVVVIVGEGAPRAWFALRTAAAPSETSWSVRWPVGAADRTPNVATVQVVRQLHCSSLEARHWRTDAGQERDAFFIRWDHAADAHGPMLLHRPDICLPAAGARLLTEFPVRTVSTDAGMLHFRVLSFESDGTPALVYHCAWSSPGQPADAPPVRTGSAVDWWTARWREILRGQLGTGLVLTVACWNEPPTTAAIDRQLREIQALIASGPTARPTQR